MKGGCLLVVIAFLLIVGACSIISGGEDSSQQRCDELNAWYADNPYDSNKDIENDYVMNGCADE